MSELLREALREVTSNPVRYLAEVAQSALLIALLWWLARRAAAKRLAARAARIGAELDAADAAERDAVRVREDARAAVEQAKREAPEIVRAATERLAAERAAATVAIAEEARLLVDQARKTVEMENARVLRDASERLVRLTTHAARRYLDDMLSEGDRRALTQKAIVQFLQEIEQAPTPEPAAGER